MLSRIVRVLLFGDPYGPARQPLHAMSEEEFKATLRGKMLDVSTNANETVQLRPYAERALRATFGDACACEWNVERIYEAADGVYQHIAIPSDVVADLYLVIVVDKRNRRILGHHRLDLGVLYGRRRNPQPPT